MSDLEPVLTRGIRKRAQRICSLAYAKMRSHTLSPRVCVCVCVRARIRVFVCRACARPTRGEKTKEGEERRGERGKKKKGKKKIARDAPSTREERGVYSRASEQQALFSGRNVPGIVPATLEKDSLREKNRPVELINSAIESE